MKGTNVGDYANGNVDESDVNGVCPCQRCNGENSTIKQIYGLMQLCLFPLTHLAVI